MLTNSRKKVHNFVLLERNYVEVSTWKMAAILTATVTTSFASLLARATLLLLDTLTKNAEREKRRRICFDCPLLREFQFSHMLLLLLQTWEFGKSLSDHHNLLEVKIDALFWLRTKSFFFLSAYTKSTRKSAVKLTGSCQPPSRHIYSLLLKQKEKSPILSKNRSLYQNWFVMIFHSTEILLP